MVYKSEHRARCIGVYTEQETTLIYKFRCIFVNIVFSQGSASTLKRYASDESLVTAVHRRDPAAS